MAMARRHLATCAQHLRIGNSCGLLRCTLPQFVHARGAPLSTLPASAATNDAEGSTPDAAPVVVLGAGVAGLTFAAALQQRCNTPCTVVDCQDPQAAGRPDRGLGIWPNARTALKRLGVWDRLATKEIPSAGYRNQGGDWLSRCSDTPENHRRVGTVRQRDLLAALWEEIGAGRLASPSTTFEVGTLAALGIGIRPTITPCNSADGPAGSAGPRKASFVVGADGMKSRVRSLIAGELEYDLPEARRTGQVHVSGFSSQPCDYPYESLGICGVTGKSARFAHVPLAQGSFWFATFPVSGPFADKQHDFTFGSEDGACESHRSCLLGVFRPWLHGLSTKVPSLS